MNDLKLRKPVCNFADIYLKKKSFVRTIAPMPDNQAAVSPHRVEYLDNIFDVAFFQFSSPVQLG